MDAKSDSILWSLKATKNKSFSLNKGDIKEVVDATEGIGGAGGFIIPAIGLYIDGEELAVLRLSDFVNIIRNDVKLIEPTKKDNQRATIRTPKLLRKDNDG